MFLYAGYKRRHPLKPTEYFIIDLAVSFYRSIESICCGVHVVSMWAAFGHREHSSSSFCCASHVSQVLHHLRFNNIPNDEAKHLQDDVQKPGYSISLLSEGVASAPRAQKRLVLNQRSGSDFAQYRDRGTSSLHPTCLLNLP
ncbi:hypothetical protein Q8A73_014708 [Channa argus]|nr:hypothetical protein Q8A73_014708 [Channa argus]